MVPSFPTPIPIRRAPLTVDTSHAQRYHQHHYFQKTDNPYGNSIIDTDAALDSGLEMSPPTVDSHPDVYRIGLGSSVSDPSVFSAKSEQWPVDMHPTSAPNPFFEPQSSHPFVHMDRNSRASGYTLSNPAWCTDNGTMSGPCTPLPQFNTPSPDYNPSVSAFRPVQAHPSTGIEQPNTHVLLTLAVPRPASQLTDWMPLNQDPSHPKRTPLPSTGLTRPILEYRRGDGVRKKNARFPIPAERTIDNIDNLIAISTNEVEIKELKQQKRLLRNRQAALDSRFRKKQHTERLEGEKVHFTSIIRELEEDIGDLTIRLHQLEDEKRSMLDYIQGVNLEKEEMIRSHTIETGQLRKRIGVLSEMCAHQGSPVQDPFVSDVGQVPGCCYSDEFEDMDGLTIHESWDGVDFQTDYSIPSQIKQEERQLLPIPTKKVDVGVGMTENDKSAGQGGLLFMLFLVGAFVLSHRTPPPIPRVSEDVRLASASLLNGVLKDAGIGVPVLAPAFDPAFDPGFGPDPGLDTNESPPSSVIGWLSTHSPELFDLTVDDCTAPSMSGDMDKLADALTQPTQQQAMEQVFSLSAAQYNGINAQDFVHNPPVQSTSQGRRNLAQAMAAIRRRNGNDKDGKAHDRHDTKQEDVANVYTRSLLFDQIPEDVVRQFARMLIDFHQSQNG